MMTSVNPLTERSVRHAKVVSLLLTAFVAVTTLAIFVPASPDMPDKGIDKAWISAIQRVRGNSKEVLELARFDQSWILAINAAVARHLRFGKEIIFTFGPYASIYSRSFHPATDRLMMVGSTLIGVCYAIGLLYLARGRTPYTIITLMLFCATFPQRDALLLSYPFILVVCAVKFADPHKSRPKAHLDWSQILITAMAFSALGLLPLIKGSLLFPVSASGALLIACLLNSIPVAQAVPLLLVPLASTAIFWIISGQPLSDLPAFLHSTIWLTSGYTEAMSTPWTAWPGMIGKGFIVGYLAVSVVIFFWLVRSKKRTVLSKWLLGLLCAPFLMVAFKHGFVRADHVPIAFTSLVVLTLIVSFLDDDRYLVGAAWVVIALVVGISFRQDPELIREVRESFGAGTASSVGHRKEILALIVKKAPGTFARVTFKNTLDTYAAAWEGMRTRITEDGVLKQRFDEAIANITSEYSIPKLPGTIDIYSYEQALLLASNNEWNPRPIFQSYSAYTPTLASLNAQHLRNANAPDWILVDLLAIDGRLPSLEDGLSWMALLDNYTFRSFDGQFVLMHKNDFIQIPSSLDVIYQKEQQTGSTVPLPNADSMVYAEVDLKPTVFGKLMIALFKPPQLDITLRLKGGKTSSYRTISSMMETGFVLSPFVSTTGDFASLMGRDRRFQEESSVESMSISPSFGGSLFWSSSYTLTLKVYKGRTANGRPVPEIRSPGVSKP